MTESSRRAFLKSTLAGGALTTGAVLLPAGLARAAAAAPQTRASDYQLRVVNNSTAFEQFAVYQNDPDLGLSNAMSLAWLIHSAPTQTEVTFEWDLTYSFMLFGRGGTTLTQIVDADTNDPAKQQIQLAYGNGEFLLQRGAVVADPKPGRLYIKELSGLPVNSPARVGIGLSGFPVFSTPVEPELDLVFTPHPGSYWLTAGTFQGGVNLDVEQIVPPVQITYPPDVFAMVATLGRDNRWTVRQDNTA